MQDITSRKDIHGRVVVIDRAQHADSSLGIREMMAVRVWTLRFVMMHDSSAVQRKELPERSVGVDEAQLDTASLLCGGHVMCTCSFS